MWEDRKKGIERFAKGGGEELVENGWGCGME